VKRKKLALVLIIVVAVLSLGAAYSYFNYFGPKTVFQRNSDQAHCRQGNVLAGVGRQARFTVLSTCERVIGIVYNMKGTKEEDGDYQFDLKVEEPYKGLLNQGNIEHANGMLVIEIIPMDQNSKSVQIPKNGDKIQVYGAWVTDNPKGWNEIHPAWNVTAM
jgi:cell division protein YceG involved in septum cleavage